MKERVRNVMIDFMPMKSFAEDPLILSEGQGIRVKDVDGREYIDGLSGTFCANLGHGDRRLAEVGARQLERLAMACPTLATNDRALELVDVLLRLLPDRYTTIKLLSGGSEATEGAIKIARQYHKQTGHATKYKILSHYQAYHGATGFAMSASGWPRWRAPYEPLATGFIHLHTPDPYRPPFPMPPESVGAAYASLVETVIQSEGPETIAGLITEPILTSAGVIIPPRDYLPAIRDLCDRYNILLIYDEIITAFGRCGSMFAAELLGAWPDVFCLGKGMSGGYAPLSAVVLSGRVAEAFWGDSQQDIQFQSGHTYGGNPVACAIGIAAIKRLLDDDLAAVAHLRGQEALSRLRAMQGRLPAVGDVRGEGLLLGLEFVQDPQTKRRFPPEAEVGIRVREAARRRGLLVRASHWMTVLAPPLTITFAELHEALDILEASLKEVLEPVDVLE